MRRKARDAGKIIIGEKPHHHRPGVPSTRYQSSEGPAGGGFGINVNVLRIELGGECDHLGLVDRDGAIVIHASDAVIFEIAPVDRDFEISSAHVQSDLVARCYSSFPTRLTTSPSFFASASQNRCSSGASMYWIGVSTVASAVMSPGSIAAARAASRRRPMIASGVPAGANNPDH